MVPIPPDITTQNVKLMKKTHFNYADLKINIPFSDISC